jgi:hypothetical protein
MAAVPHKGCRLLLSDLHTVAMRLGGMHSLPLQCCIPVMHHDTCRLSCVGADSVCRWDYLRVVHAVLQQLAEAARSSYHYPF